MTKEEALELSIEHWHRLATGTQAPNESPYAEDCALCQKYSLDNYDYGLTDEDYVSCRGCPVAAETGWKHCEGSPYYDAYNAMHDHGLNSPEFREAAKAELDFLKGLRK